ncbi:MAG: hypothetical protein IJA32_16865 [Lachnospiraceae bacterium]|nr:hypothetical protein [Lachnospiraceae bacterium]
MVKSIKMQMYEMLRKKTVVCTFFILLTFVMVNYYSNLNRYADIQYVTQMQDPIKLLTLSTWSSRGYFLMVYLPILIVFPTACSYITDRDTRVKIYIESRVGGRNYWYGKLISVFLTTFLIFVIPFIMEIVLSCVCFDISAVGDPSNFSYIQTVENENQYMFSTLWLSSRVLYAVVMTIIWGIINGILAIFNFSLTTLPFFKYKILTFFPIYILFYFISGISLFLKLNYTTNYFFILRLFDIKEKNCMVYGIFLIILVLFSVGIIHIKIKKDDIL